MKKTGRTLTLSGQMPKRPFPFLLNRNPHTVLEYANVLDINRAWKVRKFSTWIQETALEMGAYSNPFTFGLDVQLSTDEIPTPKDWNNAGDNRAIGWGTLSYDVEDSSSKNVGNFTSGQRRLMYSEYWLHPDNIIQNKLTISSQSTGGNPTVEGLDGYTLNYLIELEEVEISPVESIVFNIKGQGQSLDS